MQIISFANDHKLPFDDDDNENDDHIDESEAQYEDTDSFVEDDVKKCWFGFNNFCFYT